MVRDKIAITSGGIGDIILSIPVMKLLGIGTLYIKESYYPDGSSMYTVCKPLLETQGFTILPTVDNGKGFDNFEPGIPYNINMDAWRNIPGRGKDYIMWSMMKYWRVFKHNWKAPWIKLPPNTTYKLPPAEQKYTLFFLTERWRNNSKVDWKQVYASVPGIKYFIGIEKDFEMFSELVQADVYWLPTLDLLHMAYLIQNAADCYTNQSVFLALCHALGVRFNVEIKPLKTNCIIGTNKENILK